ncbi:MAG: hypothetical protein ABIQ44_09150 [Chloroflexia bacterium]
MFGFAQWDSPIALVLEAALSLVIVIALLFVVRGVNARAEADYKNKTNSSQPGPLESSADKQNDQHAK